MSKYDRSVELHCPTCGGVQFEFDDNDEAVPVECAGCGLNISRSDLVAANGENIEAHVEQITNEATADMMKQLKDAFRGNNFIKFK
ncbi:MAG: hypothetical protein E6Q77_03625 [Rhizobium sp.]|nr:MAG: hypothetical protein E6Q77_03625 [Rhizobium sp.]